MIMDSAQDLTRHREVRVEVAIENGLRGRSATSSAIGSSTTIPAAPVKGGLRITPRSIRTRRAPGQP